MMSRFALPLVALLAAPFIAAQSAPNDSPQPMPTPSASSAAASPAAASSNNAADAEARYHYPAPASTTGETQTWYTFNGDLEAQKYATSEQITPENVGKLTVAWQLHTGDVSRGNGASEYRTGHLDSGVPATVWSATPLFVNDTLYLSTPFYRIFAVDPGSGRVKWTFDAHAELKALTQPDLKTRGAAYWQAPNPVPGQACQKIVYVGTMAGKLWAIDADTGKPCAGFGKNGSVDVNQWNKVNDVFPLSVLQPPTVYKNLLFVGWAGKDWAFQKTPPGIVFALDAQTGALKWQFNPLTPGMEKGTGKINVWQSMSVDPQQGLLYLATSPPSPDDYGGDRKEHIPYADAVVALNAETGAVVWSRQLAHHELWDYDLASAPTLVDIKKDGKTIPALVQASKQGFIFVLNRLTGEPVYPITETPVPQGDVPGERYSATQPEESVPEPTVPDRWPGVYWLSDWLSGGWCSSEAKKLRDEGRYTPPSLRGSIVYPPSTGGVEWGGGAVDPRTNTYVVNSSSVAFIYRLIPRKQYDEETKNGTPTDYQPQAGAPYGVELQMFANWLGMPCWKPPYGTLSAYDLNTGKLLWRNPFGEIQEYGFYMPYSWGSVTIGAPVVTQSGLIFIGASMDSRVRAIDLKTGKELWRSLVDAPTVSMPAVYTYRGREYVTFAVGGNSILSPRVSDQLIAFALP
jgi:quinoprotein glucose dehydrogenase